MKLVKADFEILLGYWKEWPEFVYDRQARIFHGKEGTSHPPFVENLRDDKGNFFMSSSYSLYAAVGERTLPLEKGIIPSVLLKEGITEEEQQILRSQRACCAMLDVNRFLDTPLEVLAKLLPGETGVRDKWGIYLLREPGIDDGYIHNNVAAAIRERSKG